MGGALQGFGTPSVYPTSQLPWGFAQQSGQFGGQFGSQVPQQLQQLQAAIHQLQHSEYVQQQQIQQLLQIVPQQLHQIQQLIQLLAQQHVYQQQHAYQQPFSPSPWPGAQSFSTPGFGGTQPQMFGGQAGFGQGYVM